MTSQLAHAGASHRGLVRETNEDRWATDSELGLFMVSDGMGGEAGGETAARLVVEILPRLLRRRLAGNGRTERAGRAELVRSSLSDLSRELHDRARDGIVLSGMGATVALVLLDPPEVVVAHMGDSRVYLQDERGLALLTHDHSLVQLLVESGDITDEEARDHPARGRVTRFVGMPGEPLPEVRGLVLRGRSRFLLCSDGLTGELAPEAIERALSEECTPADACGRLVDEALRSGGRDNVTVVVVDVAP